MYVAYYAICRLSVSDDRACRLCFLLLRSLYSNRKAPRGGAFLFGGAFLYPIAPRTLCARDPVRIRRPKICRASEYSPKAKFPLFQKSEKCKNKKIFFADTNLSSGHLTINQRLTKNLPRSIDNRRKVCYNAIVIKLRIQPKEAIIMMNTYIYRMSYVSPAECLPQGLYSF